MIAAAASSPVQDETAASFAEVPSAAPLAEVDMAETVSGPRIERLAKKAESARQARLRHKGKLTELQSTLRKLRVRSLELQSTCHHHSLLDDISAALPAERREIFASWVKAHALRESAPAPPRSADTSELLWEPELALCALATSPIMSAADSPFIAPSPLIAPSPIISPLSIALSSFALAATALGAPSTMPSSAQPIAAASPKRPMAPLQPLSVAPANGTETVHATNEKTLLCMAEDQETAGAALLCIAAQVGGGSPAGMLSAGKADAAHMPVLVRIESESPRSVVTGAELHGESSSAGVATSVGAAAAARPCGMAIADLTADLTTARSCAGEEGGEGLRGDQVSKRHKSEPDRKPDLECALSIVTFGNPDCA
mmetsp:Transcript_56921/g.127112  ORF Transcript_56921/g.127112 Transcript_56921/m.127112 type:complete len:373 (-) Transcript_56921:84-1202(-)